MPGYEEHAIVMAGHFRSLGCSTLSSGESRFSHVLIDIDGKSAGALIAEMEIDRSTRYHNTYATISQDGLGKKAAREDVGASKWKPVDVYSRSTPPIPP